MKEKRIEGCHAICFPSTHPEGKTETKKVTILYYIETVSFAMSFCRSLSSSMHLYFPAFYYLVIFLL